VVNAAAASASVGTLTVVEVTRANVDVPGRKVRDRGGASIDTARNDVSLTDVKVGSYAGSPLATAAGREDVDGTSSNWKTAATAICAYS
jgi:hypothetical protein